MKRAILTSPAKSQEAKWQAEDDVRTLMRAQEIQEDKARMARAAKCAREQAEEARKVATKMTSKAKK